MAQTPLQQLERLVGALSELVAQEHAMLTEQTWEDAAALEDRIQAVIGGITLDNAPAVLADGADLLAVIHDLFAAPDIAGRAAHYQQLFTKATS